MCGIVAYIGQQQATPIIIKGLDKIEKPKVVSIRLIKTEV